MDASVLELALFLASTFLAALVAGLAGFAFGLVAAAVWLHVLTPVQTAVLIVAFGLIVQGVAVWKLRHALQWARLWPFLLGERSASRSGLGVRGHDAACDRGRPDPLQLHALLRPPMAPFKRGGTAADAGVGVLNGILGGATGLAGIIVTIWCGLRGWPKDVQRTVFQPTGVAVFAMSGLARRARRGRPPTPASS
jgi:uncharacterized protein